jgi:transglutaminase-like putative cysteine protease
MLDERNSITSSLKITIVMLMTMATGVAQQVSRSTHDQELYALARTDLKAFAQQVSKDAPSELGRAQAIVRWLAKNFEWKATDYQKRSVQEIIERGGGNCNELAMVALGAMKELNITLRRVHEVNVHTSTPERGVTAQAMVKEKETPTRFSGAIITTTFGSNSTTRARKNGFLPTHRVDW